MPSSSKREVAQPLREITVLVSPGDSVTEAIQRRLARAYRVLELPNAFRIYKTASSGKQWLVCGTDQPGGRSLEAKHWLVSGAGFRTFILRAPATVFNGHSFDMLPTRIVTAGCVDANGEQYLRAQNNGNFGRAESVCAGASRTTRGRMALGANASKVLSQISAS